MMSRISLFLAIALSAILSACLLNCGDSKLVTETPDDMAGETGNIFGTIYNPDSTPAVGAAVWLIPSGHVPVLLLTKRRLVVDSIATDSNGRFVFHTNDKGYYNLLAKGDKGVGFHDSIFINNQVKIRLNTALENPGTVRGLVRFPFGKTDHSDIVILILGTNLYIVPEDSSGQFETPPLTSGCYTLRLCTTESGFGFLDTEIMVTEGISHSLQDTLFLPATRPKPIDSFAVVLDTIRLEAHIAWSPFPKELILGYNLYRTSQKVQNEPLGTFNWQDTHYVDKVMEFDGTQVHYTITVVAKDGQETLPSPVQSLHVQSAFKADTIRLGINALPTIEMPFAEDSRGNFYFIDSKNLYKLDSLGKVLIAHPLQEQAGAIFTSRDGFVYLVTFPYMKTPNVRKYDASLNQVDSTYIPDISSSSSMNNFYISQEGWLYIFELKTRNILKTYDASFTLLRTDSLSLRHTRHMQVLDDTLLLLQQYWLRLESDNLITRYDRDMNRLSSPDLIPKIQSLFQGSQLAVESCLKTRDGQYIVSVRDKFNGDYIIILDKDMDLTGIKKTSMGIQLYLNDHGDIRYYNRLTGIVKLEL